MGTLFTNHLLNSNPSFLLLISFIIALNPSGLILGIEKVNQKIEIFSPFDITKIYKKVEFIFENIEKDTRIIAAFEDPKGYQENIFDGYGVLHELALSVANKKDLHIIPDWHAITENNYEGAINLWGRDLFKVLENCNIFKASYVLIYQESGSELDQKWNKDFLLVSELDWSDYIDEINQKRIWAEERYIPKWFILKRKI